MQAPKYFAFQGSLSTKPDYRALAADLLLTLWHKPHCFKYNQPHTLYYCQPQTRNLAVYHSFASFLWYFVPVRIYERRHKSSISWAIQAYKLICLLDITLKKDQETWLSACNST